MSFQPCSDAFDQVAERREREGRLPPWDGCGRAGQYIVGYLRPCDDGGLMDKANGHGNVALHKEAVITDHARAIDPSL